MKPAGQMSLTLTPKLERFIQEEVHEGAFASNSEYIRERYEKKQQRRAQLETLDEALARGLTDARAGRFEPLEEAFARLRRDVGLAGESSKG